MRLCSSSSFFKNKLEPGRKQADGDCGICLESLKSHERILTWCKTCGSNVHQDCLEKWAKHDMTCPMCRAPWIPREIFETMIFKEIDPAGFGIYMQWLYTDKIPEYGEDGVARCKRLIQAHMVGETLQDPFFVNAIRCEMVHNSLAVDVSRTAVEHVCRHHGTTSRTLRKFIIHLHAMQLPGNLEWLQIAPRTFLIDLMEYFVRKSKDMEGSEDIWSRLTQVGLLEKETKEEDE